MKIRCIYRLRFLRLFGVEAMTLYPWILFSGEEQSIPEDLFRHELEHIYQVQRNGWAGFYLSYLQFYFKNRWSGLNHQEAYWQIPYEVEARTAQKKPLTLAEKVALGLSQPNISLS